MIKANISGIGTALGENITNAKIEKDFNLESGIIEKTTKLQTRYFFKQDEDLEPHILKAINQALQVAKLNLNDISCIICASAINRVAIPYNAAYIHKILNANPIIQTFDINMTCLSMLRAFDIGARLLDIHKHILLVSIDIASLGLDWEKVHTAGIFGDGISAMIISQSETGGIVFSDFQTHSCGYDLCQIKAGGYLYPPQHTKDYQKLGFFEMKGKELFKLTMQVLPKFITQSLKKAKININEISYIIPHQASFSSLAHATKMLKINPEKIINIFQNHGNQIASSIPFALKELFNKNVLKSKDKIMLIGTSAGLGLGLIIWEKP